LDIGSFAELPKVGESVIVGHEYNTAWGNTKGDHDEDHVRSLYQAWARVD
jgi:hypothetical protein